ncbi:hypothetical protein [Deinococcus sp. JMULE3]|uniref:hypothetical protein n=1 Tax=Deinococcus sp. JMULE3 TaxID=2518341 RepID=UPI0015760CBB|nr:hypothetical protein [Deinococcus sp. JMULE3]NTY02500.1 hypothetical protein [Deinococcus sp. JMULE3]
MTSHPAHPSAAELDAALHALRRHLSSWPVSSAIALSCQPTDLPPPFPLPAHAPTRRHHDWHAGRRCAAHALHLLGHPDALRPLPRTPGGAPDWPAGTHGSLSHAGGLTVAAAARAPQRVGLDLEPLTGPAPGPRLWRHVLTESAFKALWPLRPDPLDPAHFRVPPPPAAPQGVAEMHVLGWPGPLQVRWVHTHGFLLALTLLPAPPEAP